MTLSVNTLYQRVELRVIVMALVNDTNEKEKRRMIEMKTWYKDVVSYAELLFASIL
jgi:hypothetical protein